MRSFVLVASLGILVAQTGSAEPYWAQISLTTTFSNAPKVLAAAEKFMSSEVGKTFPGRLLLQANIVDGGIPATHTFVPIYKSAADREAFVQSLQGNADWANFQTTLESLGQPGGTALHRNLASWGDINDTDDVWVAHVFAVSDPAAFATALDTLMKSPTGQKFPGQVYLSATVAAGISPVSHTISVGYDSVQEMADWLVVRDASADWAAYLEASNRVSSYLGATMAADLKSWGPASMADIVAP
jgi:hypothetical protein